MLRKERVNVGSSAAMLAVTNLAKRCFVLLPPNARHVGESKEFGESHTSSFVWTKFVGVWWVYEDWI